MNFGPPGRSRGGPGSALNPKGGTILATQKGAAVLFRVFFVSSRASSRKRRTFRPSNRETTTGTGKVAAKGPKRGRGEKYGTVK